MIRLSISDSYKDCDFYLNKETLFYKRCKRPELFTTYAAAFEKEYTLMQMLEEKYPDCTYFPSYLHFGLDKKSAPFLCMEYVSGITLEDYLKKCADSDTALPSELLTDWQLHRIVKQVYEALSILYSNGILYFDLSPSNIMITNLKTFEIKLIDFTFCYDLGLSKEENLSLSYKRNDSRLNTGHPLSLQIVNAFLFFFVQLFYTGKQAYVHQFTSETISAFFEPRYGNLFYTLFGSLEDFTQHELTEIMASPQGNHLFLLQRFYIKLLKSLGCSE